MCKCLDGFERMDFPDKPNIVYIICCEKNNIKIPFYVGMSTRNIGRFGDYVRPNFSAKTDFKVGETIKYLRDELKYKIYIKFRDVEDKNIDLLEDQIIEKFKNEGYSLLNNLSLSYNYKLDNEEKVKVTLIEWVRRELLNEKNLEVRKMAFWEDWYNENESFQVKGSSVEIILFYISIITAFIFAGIALCPEPLQRRYVVLVIPTLFWIFLRSSRKDMNATGTWIAGLSGAFGGAILVLIAKLFLK